MNHIGKTLHRVFFISVFLEIYAFFNCLELKYVTKVNSKRKCGHLKYFYKALYQYIVLANFHDD